MEYIAYCRYEGEGDSLTINTCHSDDKGAFKVYKKSESQEPAHPLVRPMVIDVGTEVIVYDRYRFAIPLHARVEELSKSNDGVRVRLKETNNVKYPIGNDEVWVHMFQLELDKALIENKDMKEVIQIKSIPD